MLVIQDRRWLEGRQQALLVSHRRSGFVAGAWRDIPDDAPVDSTDDEARWWSEVHAPMTSDALLDFAQAYLDDPDNYRTPHDEVTLVFRLKAMLAKHGYPVAGIERLGLYD